MARAPGRSRFAALWFDFGLWFFGLGIVASIATIALGPLPQMQVLGAVSLACAALGALVCMLGVRLYSASGWRRLRTHVDSVGESMRDATEAIGEPRRMAYARATPRIEPHLAAARQAPARVSWPV